MWGVILREEEEELEDGNAWEGSWEWGWGWKPATVRRREAGVEEEGASEDGVSREERKAESSASVGSSWGWGKGAGSDGMDCAGFSSDIWLGKDEGSLVC